MSDKSAIGWTDAIVARFWTNVDSDGPMPAHAPSLGRCWIWTAGRFSNGYGQFRCGSRKVRAHRFAFIIEHGDPGSDVAICHRCDNPVCVRDSHLFAGTHAMNMFDRNAKQRQSRGAVEGTAMRGERNGAAKLRRDDVDAIRRLNIAGVSQYALARRFGMSQSQIGNIVRGKAWVDG